jgi:hypothetical protein
MVAMELMEIGSPADVHAPDQVGLDAVFNFLCR